MDTNTSRKKPGFFINRDFALLWIGRVISRFGDFIFDTTLILWIATQIARNQSWAALAISGVLIAVSVPTLVLGPIAGVFADRWVNKRRTMLWMDAARAVLIALLLLATGLVPLPWQLSTLGQLGAIYAVVFLASICAQFFDPASSILFSDIVEEAYRTRAAGLGQTMSSLAAIAGPPLATLIFFTVGVQWALLLNALSFVASFISILLIHPPQVAPQAEPEASGNFFRELGEGIRFYMGNSVLMTLLITAVLVVLWDGAFNTLGIFFVTQNLHTSASFYGFLGTALGIGLTVGAILASLFAQRIGVTRLLWSSVLVTGVLVLIYARLTNFIMVLIATFFLGILIAATNIPIEPLALHVTPRELIGRVIAVFKPVLTLSSMLSVALAGWLESTVLQSFHMQIFTMTFGSTDTIFTLTGILAIVGGFYAMINLRGVTLKEEGEATFELEGEKSS